MMTDETHRFFLVKSQAIYESLAEHVNATRGFPDGNGTERGLPLWDDLFLDPQDTSDRLYCLDRWRFQDEDEGPLTAALETGELIEIDLDAFLQRIHWEPEIIADELGFDVYPD